MSNTKIKIFCFPYAGGSARVYKSWQKYLPPEIEVVPIEVKGRGKRYGEKLCDNMGEMVQDVFGQIRDQLQEGEYAIYGHSMGAVVAHEICYKIIEEELPTPLHLFLSGRQAPHCPKDEEEKTYLLSDDKFRAKLVDYGGTPTEVLENDELMKIFVPILRGDFKVCDTYKHQKQNYKFDFGITIMTGLEEDLSEEQIEGWQIYTGKKLNNHRFPGGHFFIHEYTFNILRIICKKIFDIIDENNRERVG